MARAGWRWWRYAALSLVGLVGLVGIVLLVWRVPPALYAYVLDPKDRAAAEASTRTGLIAGLAGLGALGSLAIASRTYRLTQQGQITDQYTKAIEQLGSDKLDVRLGGVYALERIAADSQRDHPTVVEVLSAFVREHSHPTRTTAPNPTIAKVLAALLRGRSVPAEVQQSSPARSGDNDPKGPAPQPKPTTDVQAAVTVLGRLPQRRGVSRGDLSSALLAGARLGGANLSGARLDRANLSGARLGGANLSDAWLNRANLSDAELDRANLSDAWLAGADLSGAGLGGADLSGAALFGADLSGAGLNRANLSGARLNRANLSGARLGGANLSDAWLDRADLSGAGLDGADLRETRDLTQPQLDAAHGDADTRLPDGLRRPDSWTTGEEPLSASS